MGKRTRPSSSSSRRTGGRKKRRVNYAEDEYEVFSEPSEDEPAPSSPEESSLSDAVTSEDEGGAEYDRSDDEEEEPAPTAKTKRIAHGSKLWAQRKDYLEKIKKSTKTQREFARCCAKEFSPFLTSSIRKRMNIDEHNPEEVNEPDELLEQPSNLGTEDGSLCLRDYQLIGLNFLRRSYILGFNPILGDEMGLGKTIQSISYVANLREEFGIKGPHIVVLPLSVISNWKDEFSKWLPKAKVLLFHGPRPKLEAIYSGGDSWIEKYDVVLTTYEVLVSHIRGFKSVVWHSCIVDEAHRLKSATTQWHKTMKLLSAVHTVFLTGTPIQNNLAELWALLNLLFHRSGVFSESEQIFADAFEHINQQSNKDLLVRAPHLLQKVMIRRLKSDVETNLPPKEEIILKLPLSKFQMNIYKDCLKKYARLVDDGDKSNSSVDYREVRAIYHALRKVANHPYLMDGVEPFPFVAGEHIVNSSGKMIILDRLLQRLKQEGHRVLIFSMFQTVLNIIEDYLNYRNFKYLRLDGSTHRLRRMIDIQRFNAPNSDRFVYLITNRAGGLGINLQSADTVIHFDTDWNPQADLQAQARAHRIGQKRMVKIYRLISEDTVEERMLFRSQQKLYLDAVVNTGVGKLQDQEEVDLTSSEVLQSIKFGANKLFSGVKTADGFTDKDLDLLLERNSELRIVEEGGEDTETNRDKRKDLLQKLETNVADFDFKIALKDTTSYDGKKYDKGETSWEGNILSDRAKRSRTSRVADPNAFYTVLKDNNYNMMDDFRVSSKTKQLYAKSVFDSRNKKRFWHEQWCWNCDDIFVDGDEYVACQRCPKAFHRDCYENLGLHKRSQLGKCTHHDCAECGEKSTSAGYLIRCVGCLRSYCVKCVPPPAWKKDGELEYVDVCPIMNHFGFTGSKNNQIYATCSTKCKKFYESTMLRRPLHQVKVCFRDMPDVFRKVVMLDIRKPIRSFVIRNDTGDEQAASKVIKTIDPSSEFMQELIKYLYGNDMDPRKNNTWELLLSWKGFVPDGVELPERSDKILAAASVGKKTTKKLSKKAKKRRQAEMEKKSKELRAQLMGLAEKNLQWRKYTNRVQEKFHALVDNLFQWRMESIKLLLDSLGVLVRQNKGGVRGMRMSDPFTGLVYRAAMILTAPHPSLQEMPYSELRNELYK